LGGVHCESTACRNLLAAEGLTLSEPMIFGLGSGIGFTYFEHADRKTGLREPLVWGKNRPGEIARNLAEVLQIRLVVEETVNRGRAWRNLIGRLDVGKPYGLKLDRYYLDYLEIKVHHYAHYLVACGYDDEFLYVVDEGSPQVRLTSLKGVELARSVKGFLSSKNLGFYFEIRPIVDLEEAVRLALRRSASQMLQTDVGFVGVRGIRKFAERLGSWKDNPNFKYHLLSHYLQWERLGTGGGGYRKLYSRFLVEASTVLGKERLRSAGELYDSIGSKWEEIDEQLKSLCEESVINVAALMEASKKIRRQAALEEMVFKMVQETVTY